MVQAVLAPQGVSLQGRLALLMWAFMRVLSPSQLSEALIVWKFVPEKRPQNLQPSRAATGAGTARPSIQVHERHRSDRRRLSRVGHCPVLPHERPLCHWLIRQPQGRAALCPGPDRQGPLYYALSNGNLYWSSEIKGLLAACGVSALRSSRAPVRRRGPARPRRNFLGRSSRLFAGPLWLVDALRL